jgi:hypothetical protein
MLTSRLYPTLTMLSVAPCRLLILLALLVSFTLSQWNCERPLKQPDLIASRLRPRSRQVDVRDFVLALQLRANNTNTNNSASARPVPAERAKKLATYIDLVAALRRPPYTVSSRPLSLWRPPTPQHGTSR